MANAKHLAILKENRTAWNQWREEHPEVTPDLTKADLRGMYFRQFNLSHVDLRGAEIVGDSDLDEPDQNGYGKLKGYNPSSADFTGADLRGANLSGLSFSNLDESYPERDLKSVDLRGADLTGVDLSMSYLSGAKLGELIIESSNWQLAEVYIEPYRYERRVLPTKLRDANLSKACLDGVNLSNLDLSGVNLTEASLIQTQALSTDFSGATFTGACIQDWNINSATKLDDVKCDYVYLKLDWSEERKHYLSERHPPSRSFAPGEFTKLFQKVLETVDLIFRNGVDWDAFAYSFKKVEVENSGAQLDVQSIEKKGNGVLVVRVSISPEADKAKIHSGLMQDYEFAHRVLEAQYQARLQDKDKYINQLFYLLSQANENQGEALKRISEASKYDMRGSSFPGGFAETNYGNMVEDQHNVTAKDAAKRIMLDGE